MDGIAVDRPAHLHGAGGSHGSRCLVEPKAGIIPLKSAKRHDAAGFAFEIFNDSFVLNLQHRAWTKHRPPMPHEARTGVVVSSQFAEIVAEILRLELD